MGSVNLPVALTSLIVLTSYGTGWLFSIDAHDGAYHSGVFYPLIYGNGYLYLTMAVIFIAASFRQAAWTKLEKVSLLAACMVIAIGYVVRMHAGPYLVMNAFYTLSLLIIYFAFQNPDFYIHHQMNLFGSKAAELALRELSQDGVFSQLAVIIDAFEENRDLYGNRQMMAGMCLFADFLCQKFPGCYVAYIGEGRFVVLSKTPIDVLHACNGIDARMRRPWQASHVNIYMNVHYAAFQGCLDIHMLERFIDYTAASLNRAEQDNEIVQMNANVFQQLENDARIRLAVDRAIEKNSVQIYFQPLFGTKEQQIIGAEVLARIEDPELGFIPPNVFIRVAEQSGTIMQLGEQIFAKVCIFAEHHDIHELGLKRLNVNLSAVQCRDRLLSERLSSMAAEHHLPLSLFKFEVTESALVSQEQLQDNMEKLVRQQAVFALDDFGTGYSNLVRAMRLPFADVKLDISLVREYARQQDRFLPSLIGGFKSFGTHITAEGVETEDLAQQLTALGCDILQGYYFAKPLPEHEFLQYLEGKNMIHSSFADKI